MTIDEARDILSKIYMAAAIDTAPIVTRNEIYEATSMAIEVIDSQPIRCNQCIYYQGVHEVQGHAPCSYWNVGGVLWNDFCSHAVKEKANDN